MSTIGNISNAGGVGYTELTGLGLSSDAQDQVKLDAAVSESMSSDILKALADFRAEGNFNPTSAEMEAKLSSVSVAAKQTDINEVQHLLFGFQNILQDNERSNGKDVGDTTSVIWSVSNVIESSDSALRAKYFGSDLAAKGVDGVYGVLHKYLPDFSTQIAAGYTGPGGVAAENSGWTNAQIQIVINALQNKISDLKSQANNAATIQGAAGGLTAHQWLAKEMGVDNPHDSYSLTQWGEIAQKLQVNAAKKSSQLSLGQGGGIQQVNGQYFINGEEMSLSQINFCVRANQYQLIDQQIADQLDAIQRNNAKAKEGQALLDAFKKYDNKDLGLNQSGTLSAGTFFDPTDTNSPLRAFMASQFGSQTFASPDYENYQFVMNGWNANATITSNLNEFFSMIKDVAPDFYASHVTKGDGTAASPLYSISGSISNADYLDLKTAVSTWLQSNSTDNQVAQQRLESLNNTRQAVLDGMSAFTQGQSQVTDRIGGNL